MPFAKVGTSENPADMLAKFFSAESSGRHSKNVGYEFAVDNSSTEGERQSGRVF